jgi:hypothetical protein
MPEPPESLARGTLSKGFSRNLGDLPVSFRKIGYGSPGNKGPGPGRYRCTWLRERRSIWRRYLQSRETGDWKERAGEESYEPIVPMKVGNAGGDPGDPLEGRGEQRNVLDGGHMKTPRSLVNMSTKHVRIAELAKEDKGRKFFSVAHFLTEAA